MTSSDYPTSGTHFQQEKKTPGCLSSLLSFLSPSPAPVPGATVAWNYTGVDDSRPVSQQPGPEIPMVMLQPPSATRIQPDREQLGHHPGEFASDDSIEDSPELLQLPPRARRRHNPNATHRIGRIPETEAEVRAFLAKLSPRNIFSSSDQQGPVFGVGRIAGRFIFTLDKQSFGGSIAMMETYLKLTAPPSNSPSLTHEDIADWLRTLSLAIGKANATDTPEDQQISEVEPVYGWMSESDTSSWEDGYGSVNDKYPMVQPAREHIVLSDHESDTDDEQEDIPMARPAARRMSLSKDESNSEVEKQEIPKVQPAARHMELSDDESDSDDGIQMAQPASQRRHMSDCFSVGSDDEDAGIFAYYLPATRMHSSNRVDSVTSPIDESFAHDIIFGDAASTKSHAAQISSRSDSEDNIEALEILRPDIYHDPTREPSPVVDLTQVAFHEELHRYPFFDETAEQAKSTDGTGYPDYIFNESRDLIFMGPGEYCLARFVRGRENLWARPIDQSVFADFDGDYTNEDQLGDRCSSWVLGDDECYANVFIPTCAFP